MDDVSSPKKSKKHREKITADISINAEGLNCPLPILKARKAMMTMTDGQILKVTATDPTSADDFPIFAQATKNTLIAQCYDQSIYSYWIEITL